MGDPPDAGPDRSTPRNGAMLERDAELHTLAEAVTAASAGDGSVVVVSGPAGIGKSRLLAEARAMAAAEGFTVLRASGGDLEREYPFGVVRQLFELAVHATRRDASWLDGPAAAAAAVLAPPTDAAGTQTDPAPRPTADVSFAVLHGLYWLTVNASASTPVLLVVDDLHWCDRPSLRFLAHLAPRLEGLPVLLAVGLRPDEPGTDASRGLLAAIVRSGPTAVMHPRPLSEHGVARLVGTRLGTQPDASFASGCHRATDGNPLLVTELSRALHAERVPPDAAHTDAITAVGPHAIGRTVLLRLLHLPSGTVEVARAVAVLGDGAELTAVAALADVDPQALARATDALARAEILRTDPPLGFVHPLVRDAIYRDLTPGERQLRHMRAAQVLRDLGAPSPRVATQLLALAPDHQPWVVDVLRDAARTARQAGAPDSAVAYLRRALREPPAPEQGPDLLLELGTAEGLVDAPAAVTHLTAAHAKRRDPDERTAIADLLARLLLFTRPAAEAADVAQRGAADLTGNGTRLTTAGRADTRHALEALALYAPHFGAPDAQTAARLAEVVAGLDDTGPGARSLLAVAAWDRALTGGPIAESLDLVQAALAGGVLVAADPALMSLVAVSVLILADRHEAVATCEAMLAEARRQGSLFAVTGIHQCQGWNWLRRGELAEAESCLRQSITESHTLHESTWNAGTPYAAAFLARVLLERGDVAGARQAIATSGSPATGADADALCRCVRIEVLLAEGRYRQAAAAADAFTHRPDRIDNPGWAPWRTLKAQALVHLDRPAAAVTLLEHELRSARTWSAPGTLGPALRRLGTQRRGTEGLDLLHEAVEVTAGSPAALEHAKSLTALGIALRHGGRPTEARTPLRHAIELADRCAATPLAEHARAELAIAGGRPRAQRRSGPAALTPCERRVADLAVAGHTNRDIAQTLYVTPKTIEVHLSSAYRKLGIHTRTELGDALT